MPASIGLGINVNPVLTQATVSLPLFHLHSQDLGHPNETVVTASTSSTATSSAVVEREKAAADVWVCLHSPGSEKRTQREVKRWLLMSLIVLAHLKTKQNMN